jgi:hypothetical protein
MKFFTALTTPRIDPDNGIIRSVSLMEMGDAKGHYDKKGRQVIIDEVTLEQLFKECKKLGKIKVKANHGSGVFEVIGWADNFALQANKVIADVHIYESESNRSRILEIADKNPTHMGISMEFTGEDKARGEVCLCRCDGVVAAALVDDPAANSSLFSAKAEEKNNNTNNTTNMENEEEKDEPTLADVMSKFEELNTRLTALESPPEEKEAKEDESELSEETKEEEKTELAGPSASYKVSLSEDEKKDEDKKIELAAKRGAEAAIKAFTAKLGITNLGKAGSISTPAKTKHFEEHVADLAVKEFSGDQTKARIAILTNKGKHPDAWKAYESSRHVKTV